MTKGSIRSAWLCAAAAAVTAAALLAGCASTATVDDSRIGLRKAGVFEVSEPAAFTFDGKLQPTPPLPGSGMPPMIGHAVAEYLPITARGNDCLECHDKPGSIGRPVAAGRPKPAPMSHYRGAPTALALSGAFYNCMGCHAPQADVAALVRNDAR